MIGCCGGADTAAYPCLRGVCAAVVLSVDRTVTAGTVDGQSGHGGSWRRVKGGWNVLA
jgi:hypothetical protein